MIVTVAAILFTVLTALLIIFQIALSFGAPIGFLAWGGQHKILPAKMRVASLLSIVIYTLMAIVILSKAGVIAIFSESQTLTVTTWIIAGYLTFGILLNAISRSKPERYTMTPVALLMAVAAFIVAL